MDTSFVSNSVQERDFSQSVISLGSHRDNDIVLSGEGIFPFHATVLQEGEKYRIIPAETGAQIWVDGNALHDAYAIFDASQQIEVGSYALFFQSNGLPADVHVIIYAGVDEEAPEEFLTDDGAEAILINMISGEADIEVEQSAFFEFEVVNAGPIVARFMVSLRGVPKDWVEISPSVMNLNEERRQLVQVRITPPRDPDSEAGTHALQVVVTSPNYGRQRAVENITLTIQPFYEFTLGNLSPKTQRIPWRKRTGITYLPISNRSNTLSDFNLMAMDDEGGCSFDFLLEEDLQLNRQASLKLQPRETIELPIQITPLKNPMFALRSKQFHYTTNVQIPQQITAPQIVSGSVKRVPLFGWWSIMVGIAALVLALFFILQPNIRSFDVAAGKDVIELGDTTKLEWNVSPFATRLSLSNIDQPIERGQVSETVAPTQSTTYELTSGNWLSGMFNMDKTKSVTVLVVPPTPQVNVFEVDRTEISKGQMVRVRWSVSEADEVLLTIDEVVYPKSKEEYSGEEEFLLEKDALITLEAKNASGSELQSYFVNVVPPYININTFAVWVREDGAVANPNGTEMVATSAGGKLFSPTNAPDPNFPVKFVEMVPEPDSETGYRVQFNPDVREELQKGEQVMLEWDIDGADSLQIAPFTDALPERGSQPFFPQESMNFVMTAISGELEGIYMLPVKVFDGEPPEAPKIDFFKASPASLPVAGEVEFSWSVSGEWTYINISDANGIVADYLNPVGFTKLNIAESATLILTAYNGELSSAKDVQITVDPALKVLDLRISKILPETNYFRVGEYVDVFIDIIDPKTGEKPDPYPTGTVIVSDGYAVCPPIELPLQSCRLVWNAAGTKNDVSGGHPIIASYPGDGEVYAAVDSDPFDDRTIIVEANQVSLSPKIFYLNKIGQELVPDLTNPIGDLESADVTVGEGLYVVVTVNPVNTPLDPDDEDGTVTVRHCPVDDNETPNDESDDEILEQECTSALPATVIVSPGTPAVGEAFVMIRNFEEGGKTALLISYKHKKGAYEPIVMGTGTADDPLLDFTVGRSKLVFVPADGEVGCDEYSCTVTQIIDGSITFNAFMKIEGANSSWNEPLYATYPEPNIVKIKAEDNSGNELVTWGENECAWKISGTDWQYECTGVTIGDNVEQFTFTFAEQDSNYIGGQTLSLTVKEATEIAIPNDDFLADKYVGTIIQLIQGSTHNIQLKRTFDDSFIDGTIYLTLQDADKKTTDYLVVSGADTVDCHFNTDEDRIEIKQTVVGGILSDTNCAIAFKRAGTHTLVFRYEGNGNYNGTTEARVVTVDKQTGVSVSWAATSTSSDPNLDLSANPWEFPVFTDVSATLTFSCPSGASCDNFESKAFAGAEVTLTPPAMCTVEDTQGNALPDPASISSTNDLEAKLRCTGVDHSAELAVAFADVSIDDFEISSGSSQAIDIGKKGQTLTADIRRFNSPDLDDSTSVVTTDPVTSDDIIETLYVQEVYEVVVSLQGMPADAEIEGDEVTLTWARAVRNNLINASADKMTCSTDSNDTGLVLEKNPSTTTTWEARCRFTFDDEVTPGNKDFAFELSSDRFEDSTPPTLPLQTTSSIVKMEPTVEISLSGGVTPTGASVYTRYALSDPDAVVTISADHHQVRVSEDLEESVPNGGEFTITINGTDITLNNCDVVHSGSTNPNQSVYTCPFDASYHWDDEIVVSYQGTDTFAALSSDKTQGVTIEAVPVQPTGEVYYMKNGNELTFPRFMQCIYCTGTNKFWYLYKGTHTIRVYVETAADPSTFSPDITGGKIKFEFLNSSGGSVFSKAANLTSGEEYAEFDINLTANTVYYGYKLTYIPPTGDTAYSAGTSSTTNKTIYVRTQLSSFAIKNRGTGYSGFNVDSPNDNDQCFKVFFEDFNKQSRLCEEDNGVGVCWGSSYTSPPPKMYVYCASGGDIGDQTIAMDGDPKFRPENDGTSYQLFVWNGTYIGYIWQDPPTVGDPDYPWR